MTCMPIGAFEVLGTTCIADIAPTFPGNLLAEFPKFLFLFRGRAFQDFRDLPCTYCQVLDMGYTQVL